MKVEQIDPLAFFARLKWLDGRPLLDTIEPYRRRLFSDALFQFRPDDGSPLVNQVLSGRAKKNYKSTDLVLAALYRLLIWKSPPGFSNDCIIIANDEDQSADNLDLSRRLILANPVLSAELSVLSKEIRRRDGGGVLKILPARDAIGAHGKSYLFLGIDEIHGQKDWRLLEALQPDPSRPDTMVWITSYDSLWDRVGIPLHDLKSAGIRGDDPRFLLSWYSADLCTDPAFASLPPEERANPSMASWPEGRAYIDQQKRRLPSNRFRRLHLNLPGSPDGAFLDQNVVLDAIVSDRSTLPPPENGFRRVAFTDLSGGSSDEATLALAYVVGGKVVIETVFSQTGKPPFNPRLAVKKFASEMHSRGIREVSGDAYAGETFRYDFQAEGIRYRVSAPPASELYEAFEPRLNAGEVVLPDIPKLQEQLLGLVVRGSRVTHLPGEHDDWANAVAGAVYLATQPPREVLIGSCAMGGAITWHEPKKKLWKRRIVDESGTPVHS